mmetsp:Transcript_103409/g.316481  ORF Transcript_103409/g.316481 Transcript_103409/m.316481 type:complete len:265 (-) Transcript_103409:1115-1909(-)
MQRWERGHDVGEARRVDRQQAALRPGLQKASVGPRRPQRRLGQPLLREHPVISLKALRVRQSPGAHEVHLGHRRHLELREQHVAAGEGHEADRGVADLPHASRVDLVVQEEERVSQERRRVHLIVDLRSQRVRDQVQQLDLALRDVAHALPKRVPGVALDPHAQPRRDPAVRQVPVQRRELLRPLARDHLQARHRGGQGADERRGDDEGERQHGDHERSLHEVGRLRDVLADEQAQHVVEGLHIPPGRRHLRILLRQSLLGVAS